MFWNLFEKIINAVRPGKKSQQVSDVSQPWNDSDNGQQEDSPQPSSEFQETQSTSQQDQW